MIVFFDIVLFIEVCMVEIVFFNYINYMGILFGGQVLVWMDKVVFFVVVCYLCCIVVIVCLDQVDFKLFICIGQMVEIVGCIVEVGCSLMKVEVELIVEDLYNGECKFCMCGYFVMIVLDDVGQLVVVLVLFEFIFGF